MDVIYFMEDMGDILIEELKETHGPMEWLDESSIIFNQPRIHCAYANMSRFYKNIQIKKHTYGRGIRDYTSNS